MLFFNDGGQTFAATLVSNVANNGTVNIIVPSTATNTGRIKVVSVSNYYYDINNVDISITDSITLII